MIAQTLRFAIVATVVSSFAGCGQSRNDSEASSVGASPAAKILSCAKPNSKERLVVSWEKGLPNGATARVMVTKGLLTSAPYFGTAVLDGLALSRYFSADGLVGVEAHGNLRITQTMTFPSTTLASWTKLDGTTVTYSPCVKL